jgi:hypothetical protein
MALWLDVIGTNLGLQTREISALWSRQGDWKVVADYNELWSVNPYTFNTGVTGMGTTTPSATYLTGGPGSGYDTEPRNAGINDQTGRAALDSGYRCSTAANCNGTGKE